MINKTITFDSEGNRTEKFTAIDEEIFPGVTEMEIYTPKNGIKFVDEFWGDEPDSLYNDKIGHFMLATLRKNTFETDYAFVANWFSKNSKQVDLTSKFLTGI